MARNDNKGLVYLIHFHQPLSNHALHYIGFTESKLKERLARHRRGDGAKILAACVRIGIRFDIVRVWRHVDRDFERRLKNRKNAQRLCPECKRESDVQW